MTVDPTQQGPGVFCAVIKVKWQWYKGSMKIRMISIRITLVLLLLKYYYHSILTYCDASLEKTFLQYVLCLSPLNNAWQYVKLTKHHSSPRSIHFVIVPIIFKIYQRISLKAICISLDHYQQETERERKQKRFRVEQF